MIKKFLFICIIVSIKLSLFAQENLSWVIGAKYNYSYGIITDNGNIHNAYGGDFGLKTKQFSITVSFLNAWQYDDYKYQLLGLSFKYRFLKPECWQMCEKFLVPFITISAHTQIGTNYYNGLINDQLTGANVKNQYKGIQYYRSNAFYGNILIGSDFRLATNFYLEVGLGLGKRNIITQDIFVTKGIINNELYYAVAQLGLNYYIPFKAKEK